MSGPHTEILEMTWKLPELLRATHDKAQSRTMGETEVGVSPPGKPLWPPKAGGTPAVCSHGTVAAASPALGGCLAQGGAR